jgi:hypothetical protein
MTILLTDASHDSPLCPTNRIRGLWFHALCICRGYGSGPRGVFYDGDESAVISLGPNT